MAQARAGRYFVCVLALCACVLSQSTSLKPEFMPFERARPVIRALNGSLPPELKSGAGSPAEWAQWVHANDGAVRKRLEQGEEDTLTNLLRFGVTFTKEYRIDNLYLARYGHSSLVDGFAKRRANDLVRALAMPGSSEGIVQMRLFLEKKGFSFRTPEARQKVQAYLLANLARMRDEFVSYSEKLKGATPRETSELYAERGISLDTNLWPDFALHQQLQGMVKEGLIKPGSIRRVAIIGPGLDFANKELGNDFYPPQTIQPFAVIDSLAQLGLANPETIDLYTFDISSSVNVHIARLRQRARAGRPYAVQLAWDKTVPRSQSYLAGFTPYWKALGNQIGIPVPPLPVPAAVSGQVMIRAVKIRPSVVSRVFPVDMNIVFQSAPLAPADKFDLVIGTNIFVYYGPLEQALARTNVSALMKPGAFLLTNDLLSDAVSSGLMEPTRTTTVLSVQPAINENMYCYRRDQN